MLAVAEGERRFSSSLFKISKRVKRDRVLLCPNIMLFIGLKEESW